MMRFYTQQHRGRFGFFPRMDRDRWYWNKGRGLMAMKIGVLEDNEDRQAVMRARLTDRFYQYDTCLFASAGEMIHFLDEHLADTLVISLDHDLELRPGRDGRCADPGMGREVADYLAGHDPVCRVILRATYVQGSVGIEGVLRDA